MRTDSDQGKVVSIFASKNKEGAKAQETDSSELESGFEGEINRFKDAQARLKKERAKANRAVLRSYRIKT